MKKKLIVLGALLVTTLSAGCSKNDRNTLVALDNEEILHVGEDKIFYNYEDVETEESYLEYVVQYKYNLTKSRYETYDDSEYYDGYYYSLTTSTITDEHLLGTRTVTTGVSYSYLGLNEDNGILVKTTHTTDITYSYPSHWLEKDFDVEFNLNDHFATIEQFEQALPKLAAKVQTAGKKKYYVDATTPKQVYSIVEDFTTYYYIEDFND